MTKRDLDWVAQKLNDRPRKRDDYVGSAPLWVCYAQSATRDCFARGTRAVCHALIGTIAAYRWLVWPSSRC